MSEKIFENYKKDLSKTIDSILYSDIQMTVNLLIDSWKNDNKVFICGNGGSAGNANHIANDFLYVVSKNHGKGMKFESLSANSSVITCLANDISYDDIYSEQIKTKASKDDLIILLSGSGNSNNIIKAIDTSKNLKVKTLGVFGFNGGSAKELVDNLVHFNINDMQISEDLQLSLFHICMKIISDKLTI